MKLQSEQSEVLTYIAKLQGRSTDDLVQEVLEDWLVNSYSDVAIQGEADNGLLPTVICKRGKLDEKAAYRQMRQNLKTLAARV